MILWTGPLAFGLAYFTWMWALKKGDKVILSNLAYWTPVVSLFLIWLLPREPISSASFAGLAVILFGVVLQSVPLHIHQPRRTFAAGLFYSVFPSLLSARQTRSEKSVESDGFSTQTGEFDV